MLPGPSAILRTDYPTVTNVTSLAVAYETTPSHRLVVSSPDQDAVSVTGTPVVTETRSVTVRFPALTSGTTKLLRLYAVDPPGVAKPLTYTSYVPAAGARSVTC